MWGINAHPPATLVHLVGAAHAGAHGFEDPPLVLPVQERGELVQQQHLRQTTAMYESRGCC